jgi:hypothetical protein
MDCNSQVGEEDILIIESRVQVPVPEIFQGLLLVEICKSLGATDVIALSSTCRELTRELRAEREAIVADTHRGQWYYC